MDLLGDFFGDSLSDLIAVRAKVYICFWFGPKWRRYGSREGDDKTRLDKSDHAPMRMTAKILLTTN